jgi:hypothetical protein
MDISKLTTGERVIAASGLLFLIAMFLPWWGLDFGEFGSASNNGWDYFLTGWLPLLIIIVMIVQIGLEKFSTTDVPTLPLPWSQVHLIAGAVVAVLVLLRVVIGADEGAGGLTVDLDRMWGLWVALLAAIGVGVGGYLKSQEPQSATPPEPFAGGPGVPPPPGGSSF